MPYKKEDKTENAPVRKVACGRKPRDYECGLKLVYQPIVNPMFAKTIGYEALIRLVDKEMRFLSPAVFIPIAEKTGLYKELGNWVFEETFRTMKKMKKKNISFEYISVNASAKHINVENFLPDLISLIEKYEIDPKNLCIELSEFDIQNKSKDTIKKMRELRKLGLKVAIDDFGAGFASLSKLSSLPVDILKLDKSFVDRIAIDTNIYDIAKTIVELADKLGMEVVAKGVEDIRQSNALMTIGCYKMQGYLFGMPKKEHSILYPKTAKKAPEDE